MDKEPVQIDLFSGLAVVEREPDNRKKHFVGFWIDEKQLEKLHSDVIKSEFESVSDYLRDKIS